MPKQRSGGRPAHIPTDESREAVATLTAAGWPQLDICKLLRIGSKETLRKYYSDELVNGALSIKAELTGGAVKMALAGDRTMMIFVLKTRFGWRDREAAPPADGGIAAIANDPDPEVTDRGDTP